MVHILKENFNHIAGDVYRITGNDIGSYSNSALQQFYDVFFKRRMLLKVDRFDEGGKKLRYPKRMEPVTQQEIGNFEESKFYMLTFERPHKKKAYVYLWISIIVVLGVCLFPVWPLSLKLGVWWVLFGMTVFLVKLY